MVHPKLLRTSMEIVSDCWNRTSPGGRQPNEAARSSFRCENYRTVCDLFWQDNTVDICSRATRYTWWRRATRIATSLIRPVSVFRCRYEQTDTHLRINVPVVRPTIVRDWMRDQVNYGGWNASRLLSWLLIEDETAGLQTEDDAEAPEFLEIPIFAARMESVAGKAGQQRLVPSAVASRVPCKGATDYYNGSFLQNCRPDRFLPSRG